MIDFHSAYSVKKHIRFVIPSYQRGYRWRKEDAEKLLKDLLAHTESRYCLQPLELQELEEKNIPSWVISKGSNWRDYVYYRVVDGQQRLTTVSIISHILGCSFDWDILYDTEETLLSEMLPCRSDLRINDFFRKQVYESAEAFIKKLKNDERERLFCYFSGEVSKLSIVFPTHYLPLDEKTDPEGHNAFSRLNAGKTPLTSSELIRALYMVQDNGLSENQRIEIAKEWELIENTLKQEQYWRMFKAGTLADTPTRIDLLFALVLKAQYQNFDWDSLKINPRMIFETLETEYYNSKIDLQKLWHEVIRCFWWIQSSYEDVETYNYLGWIALCTDNMAFTVYQAFLDNPSKENFRKMLIRKILDNGICGTPHRYENPRLKDLLLLLNILECNKSKVRFCFDRLDTYDIEHIDSQTPNDLSNEHDRLVWLKSIWYAYPGTHNTILEKIRIAIPTVCEQSIDDDIEKFCKQPFSDEVLNGFQNVLQKCRSVAEDEKIAEKDALGNLTLLNSHINRSYKNAVFPRKREKIIEAIEDGSQYIPTCTIKVFTKFYTKDAYHLTEWTQRDFDRYKKQMEKLLDEFQKMDVAATKTDKMTIDLAPAVPAFEPPPADCSFQLRKASVSPWEKISGEIPFQTLMDHYHIRVPKIQRLYVQGRLDSYGQNCLHGFAQGLVDSVIKGTPFPLDMIYGIANTVEGDTTEVFFPLDGQQRLTTLLLLAWLCGKIGENWKLDYESRRATEVFIEGLLRTAPPRIRPNEKSKEEDYPPICTQYIEKQGWFLNVWKQDPGISGMLRMLDSLYDKLTRCESGNYTFDKITFSINYLDVNDKSYDHIFLKMNSRGRQLTAWENLKAVLDKNLHLAYQQTKDIQLWKECIDLTWPEKLWVSFKPDIAALDKCMTEVLDLAAKYAGYTGKIEDVFALDQWLTDPKNIEKVKVMFQCAATLFKATEVPYSDSKMNALTPVWRNRPCELDFQHRNPIFMKNMVAFFATDISTDSEWMRVVWNIIENGGVEKNNFPSACKLIKELSVHANDILDFLASDSCEVKVKFAEVQFEEECAKAKLMRGENGPEWKKIIKSVEENALLRGKIKAVLWKIDNFETNINDFRTRINHFNTLISEPTVENIREISAALLSLGDYTKNTTGNNWRFIVDQASFDYYLHNPSQTFLEDIYKLLMSADSISSCGVICDNFTDCSQWRYYFIRYRKTFLNGSGYYYWASDFCCRKIDGTNLLSYHQSPYLEAAGLRVFNRYNNFIDQCAEKTVEITEQDNVVIVRTLSADDETSQSWKKDDGNFVEWLRERVVKGLVIGNC